MTSMLPIIKPMEPISIDHLSKNKNSIYQIKWDGVRVLTNISDQIQLYTRNGNDRTKVYPEITAELRSVYGNQSLVLDGEMISLVDGRPSFFEVMKRDGLKNAHKIQQAISHIPVYYVVFDILRYQDCWLTNKPLAYRLNVLDNFKKETKSPLIQFCPSSNDPDLFYNYTKKHGWEGIVMKELRGIYYAGKKHPTWKKLKHFQTTEATVIGIEQKNKRAHAILLAIQESNEWKYVGKAATGLSQSDLQLLTDHIGELITNTPLVNLPSYPQKDVTWIRPLLTVKVQFLEFTPVGHLRSPVIQGFLRK